MALNPALQPAASPVRLPSRRLHLIGAGYGPSLIREESPLRAILNQAPEIEVGMFNRQAAHRKEKIMLETYIWRILNIKKRKPEDAPN